MSTIDTLQEIVDRVNALIAPYAGGSKIPVGKFKFKVGDKVIVSAPDKLSSGTILSLSDKSSDNWDYVVELRNGTKRLSGEAVLTAYPTLPAGHKLAELEKRVETGDGAYLDDDGWIKDGKTQPCYEPVWIVEPTLAEVIVNELILLWEIPKAEKITSREIIEALLKEHGINE